MRGHPEQGDSTVEAPPEWPTAVESVPALQSPSVVLDSVLGVAEILSEAERAELRACEAVIAAGWQAFVEVGLALARIRDARLYRVEYDTFHAYCREKWHYGERYANRLISAAAMITHLRTICSDCQPDHEGQVRPLVSLTPAQAQLAWTCAVENAGGRKITARSVKRAMQDLGLAPPPKPGSHPDRNEKAERRKRINDAFGQLLMLISQKAAHQAILQLVEALQRQVQPLLQPQSRAATPGN